MSTNHFNFFFRLFAHLAKTAFLALSLRCSGVSFAARALPPFRPPRRPNATAAGFFVGFCINSISVAKTSAKGEPRFSEPWCRVFGGDFALQRLLRNSACSAFVWIL